MTETLWFAGLWGLLLGGVIMALATLAKWWSVHDGHRRRCALRGHKWRSWSPGSDAWCVRWFCDAEYEAPVTAFIRGALRQWRSER